MSVSDHPELEQLKNYLNNSGSAEFDSLRLHLAQCAPCRALVEGLMGLERISQQIVAEQAGEGALSEQQHQQIVDYIDGRLSGAEQQQLKEFIQSDPSAIKAALHYASHTSAMAKAELKSVANSIAESSADAGNSQRSGLMEKVKDLIALQTPVWFTVPVTAALMAVLSVNLLDRLESDPARYMIASYQDNAVIQFRPKEHLPGIGFFAKSAELSEAYGNLKVSVSEDRRFTIQWPPVAQAIKYTLRLQMFKQGNKLLIGEVTTDKTTAVIATEIDDIHHRYKWVLSGETSDHRVFSTSGGFVINNLDKGILR